jgi:hypothetical protein
VNAADARAVQTHTDQIVIADLKPDPAMKDSGVPRLEKGRRKPDAAEDLDAMPEEAAV